MMNPIFSKRLKALRTEFKKTQEDMSKLLNCQRSTYGEYERGRIMPPGDKLTTLADYFNVSVDYLLGNTNFTNHEEKHKTINTPDIIDVSSTMKLMLDRLKNNTTSMKFDGMELDNESRELLISSLENSLKMTEMIIKKDK